MRPKFSLLLPALLVSLSIVQSAQAKTAPEVLVRKALSADAGESATAIAELRTMGPAGLSLLTETYAAAIERQIADPSLPATPEWIYLSAALDAVSQQKDSYISGLYWYTDLGEATAAAREANKPILSLRLLGKLSEELSCANSRFFRTVLYPNSEVSRTLREKFVLHWQSVRPAPRVTIDFGDGRKLERTLTGNSIHYILDADGVPIDALPGLYGPAAFVRSLDRIEKVFQELAKPGDRKLKHHRDRLNAINLDWQADIRRSGGKAPKGIVLLRNEDVAPTALEAAPLAVTKSFTEVRTLRFITPTAETSGGLTDEAIWHKIAMLHLADAKLDVRSLSLIKRKTRTALGVGGSPKLETALATLVKQLELNIALDTVRNEYLMHPRLHAWLIGDKRRGNVDALNEKVYAELFLTPASDPWLGLVSTESYTALDNGGIIQ